ncbi:nucleotidyltransferase family protein [Planktotalea sp.]|uniref:nucleotidyltransferase family protein n=1 Tax=Planktotalea sp. TaxID=2029877 RepID=UPI0032985D0B
MSTTCLLPAAGASSRMRGGDKLLEDVHGAPCLAVMAQRALAAGMEVIVTLPSADHPRAQALTDLPVTMLVIPDATARGMSASLAEGTRAISHDAEALMVLPADMPNITADDMTRMLDRFQRDRPKLLRARAPSGQHGHPILFSAELRDEFAHLSGDTGAQSIVRKHQADIAFIDFEDERVTLDLDTPEDWAAWRASL